ncbi:MAG: acetyl-CoA C-acetyltransferase [Eubacteriales bacterium]
MSKDLYVVSCCRTAVGKFSGSLASTPAPEMGGIVIKEALSRAGVKPENVDEVMFGCVLTAGLGQNVARQSALKAGIPIEVPAYTVGMVCGSGLKTVIEAGRTIMAGDADIIVCGGTENMSAAPYSSPAMRSGARMGPTTMVDTMVNDGLTDATDLFRGNHMGLTAENLCEKYSLTREQLDTFAVASQNKAEAAQAAGKFEDEIVAVPVKVKKEMVDFKVDEHLTKGATIEKVSKLRPAFKKDGMVTAANASGINDGAAAIVLASGEAVAKYGLKPMAKLISWGQGGVDPTIMGIGPVPATKQACEKIGISVKDLDLIEANEAFAAQSLAVAKDLDFDMSKVNVNGGAIALGHPVGASGARIIVTLLHEMKKQQADKGLATLCIGGGMGVAAIFELCK